MQTVSRGTKDQLLIGKKIKKGCNRQLTSSAVTWIDYHKAYNIVPYKLIQKCIVAINVRSFVNASMKQ